jgi:hypothetical protein
MGTNITTPRPADRADLPTMLRTQRLVLVPLAIADAGEMAVVLADPTLYAFIGGEPLDEATLRRRYAQLVVGHSADGTEAWHNWIVRMKTDHVAVGTVQATVHLGGPASRRPMRCETANVSGASSGD